jgi:Stage II sporulation protein M
MESTYRIKSVEIYKISLFLLISIVIGVFFGSLLQLDLTVKNENIGMLGIFINNLIIGVVLVFLTSLVAYPIILFNGFFLGLNIFSAIQLFGTYKTFLTLVFHTPLEIFGWILCILASKRMFIFYKELLKRQYNFRSLLYIFKIIGLFIFIYLLAAIIEYYMFQILGGVKWLN